jgi:hypothetical protein
VGPEPLQRWGLGSSVDPAVEPVVLARPAAVKLTFAELLGHYAESAAGAGRHAPRNASRGAHSGASASASASASLYMEYMPLAALPGAGLAADVPDLLWTHVLNPQMLLLWLGGGGERKNGRLHFDNFENLMTVISGTKTFMLFGPDQSPYLYADRPMRSANLEAEFVPAVAGEAADPSPPSPPSPAEGKGRWRFRRLPGNVHGEASPVHTYAPVSVLAPDYAAFPLLREARGFNCTLSEVRVGAKLT